MPVYLKYATASQEIALGPFVDSTDGDTEEAGLTIANTDIKLWKAGATTLASKNSGGATYISNGVYYAVLDATDTDTVGSLVIFVHVSGALPVRLECHVLPALVFDSLIAGSDALQVDTIQVGGTAQTGNDVGADVNAILVDTAELQTDLVDGGRIDALIDAILLDTGTTLDAALAVVDANVDAILVDTGTTLPATLGTPAADLAADVAAVKVDTAAVLADTGTDGVVVNAASLAADAAQEIADALLATVAETAGSYTVQQILSILLSVLAGVTASSGATLKTPDGTATRVAATINASSERTAMTLTPSA